MPRPRMNRWSSLRGRDPNPPVISVPPGDPIRSVFRGPADRTDDVLVAGAPADLAGDGLPDLRLVRVRVAVEQPARGHHHARRAEPALEAVALDEPLLHRVKLAVPLQAFD